MSTSSKADEPAPRGGGEPPRGRAGFTLIECLVALVVAGLVLPALARAFAGAWASTRTPMDVVSGMALAQDVAAGGPVPPEARGRNFAVERRTVPATVLVLPSDVAPAPRGTGKGADAGEFHPEATPSAFKLALPEGLGGPGAGATPAAVALRRVAVTVRTPAGRRLPLDALSLDDAAR